ESAPYRTAMAASRVRGCAPNGLHLPQADGGARRPGDGHDRREPGEGAPAGWRDGHLRARRFDRRGLGARRGSRVCHRRRRQGQRHADTRHSARQRRRHGKLQRLHQRGEVRRDDGAGGSGRRRDLGSAQGAVWLVSNDLFGQRRRARPPSRRVFVQHFAAARATRPAPAPCPTRSEWNRVARGPDEVVLPDAMDRPLAVRRMAPVVRAIDRAGNDVTGTLARDDAIAFQSDRRTITNVRLGDVNDWIDVTIAPPHGVDSVALVFRLRNSLLNTVLLYDAMLRPQGAQAVDFEARDLNTISRMVAMGRWYGSR